MVVDDNIAKSGMSASKEALNHMTSFDQFVESQPLALELWNARRVDGFVSQKVRMDWFELVRVHRFDSVRLGGSNRFERTARVRSVPLALPRPPAFHIDADGDWLLLHSLSLSPRAAPRTFLGTFPRPCARRSTRGRTTSSRGPARDNTHACCFYMPAAPSGQCGQWAPSHVSTVVGSRCELNKNGM